MQRCFITHSVSLAGSKQIRKREETPCSKTLVLQGCSQYHSKTSAFDVLTWLRISQDPYASGLAEAPFEFNKLKQENMGAPSAGGIAHWSQKHKRVLTEEHNLPPSIGVANLVPALMHNSFVWTAKRGRPLACGAEKPMPKQKM